MKIINYIKKLFINKNNELVNTSVKCRKFIIPIGGASKQRCMHQLNTLMKQYQKVVQWDDSLGEVTINDNQNVNNSTLCWFPPKLD